jgi:inorganic pyrophosphatase
MVKGRIMSSINNENFFKALEQLIEQNGISIDRTRGSSHPRFPTLIYPLDYGYINGTKSQDGSGIDLVKGDDTTSKIVGIICTVDTVKKDSEVKVLFNCTEENIKTAMIMFNNQVMKGILLRRTFI